MPALGGGAVSYERGTPVEKVGSNAEDLLDLALEQQLLVGVGVDVGPLGPLGSSSSHHRRTLELVLQRSPVSFRIT